MLSLGLSACIYTPTPQQQATIDEILVASRQTVANERFVSTLRKAKAEEFDHDSDPDAKKPHGGAEVLAGLQAHLPARVMCRWPNNPFNRKTKAWDGGGVPRLRCDLFDERSYADWVGTILHETAHAAGYFHDGQSRDPNQCTVPHVIGDLATLVASGQSSASLPRDVCEHLPAVLERAGTAGGTGGGLLADPSKCDEGSPCSPSGAWFADVRTSKRGRWQNPKRPPQRAHAKP
jgi:hypothetical protein